MQQHKNNKISLNPSKSQEIDGGVIQSPSISKFSKRTDYTSKSMAEVTPSNTGQFTGYRLQRTAYVNRPDVSSLSLENLHLGPVYHQLRVPKHNANPYTDYITNANARWNLNYNSKNGNYKQHSTSSVHFPDLLVTHATYSPSEAVLPSQGPKPRHRPQSSHRQTYSKHKRSTSEPSGSRALSVIPPRTSRTKSSRTKTIQESLPKFSNTRRRRRHSFEDDPNKLAMKMSLPCSSGCCYCVYTSLLGPVRVYFTRADKPKKEPFICGIKDGNGRAAIPASRKSDVRGLVYDRESHSLHPPARGQRPMFRPVPTGPRGRNPARTDLRTK